MCGGCGGSRRPTRTHLELRDQLCVLDVVELGAELVRDFHIAHLPASADPVALEENKKAQEKATYAGNWITQIKEVAGHFKHIQFVRVTGPESSDVDFGRSNIDVITTKVLKRKLKHT